MKKVLIVLACIALVLPLFALSAFAVDSNVNVSVNIPMSIRDFEVVVDGVSSTYTSKDDFSLSVSPDVVHSISGIVTSVGGTSYRLVVNYEGTVLSTDSSNPTVLSDSATFVVSRSDFNNPLNYYFLIESPPNPLAPVDDGVSAFIGFGGDVLHFITNNSAILTLVGLSVGLCLVIPFGISKIKDLLKGY